MVYDEAVAELPICRPCLDDRYLIPSRRKFNPDANVNSVCFWGQSRGISDRVRIEEHDTCYVISVGNRAQRIPKNAEPITRGFLFRRLDRVLLAGS